MIIEYKEGDEKLITPNRYSENIELASAFLRAEGVGKKTIEHNGNVMAVVMWKEYAPRKYVTALVIDKKAGLSVFRDIKTALLGMVKELSPLSVVTYSLDDGIIYRWHRFLGFNMEAGSSQVVDGKTYNKWVMKWA